MTEGWLIVVVALKAEATPFVNWCRLPAAQVHASYRLHQGERLSVLVTGMGAARAQRAVAQFVADKPKAIKAQWLNVGIAGGVAYAVGELVWVASARYHGERQSWPLSLPDLNTSGVTSCSVSQPVDVARLAVQLGGGGDCRVFDMELAGLVNGLLAFGLRPFCAKVISDNQQVGVDAITAQVATNLIRQCLPQLAEAIPALGQHNHHDRRK